MKWKKQQIIGFFFLNLMIAKKFKRINLPNEKNSNETIFKVFFNI